jgi:MGT family glycosyltransferase
VEGAAEEPVNLVVAIGPDQDPARFGSVPSNVRLEPYLPQAALLSRCDAFVTHGGFNSVKESLISGVPMVVVPIAADQPYCAERCAALGVAEVVGAQQRTAERVAQGVRQVLGDPAYRERVGRFRGQMLALPGPERMVELLEALATGPSTLSEPSAASA